MTQTAQVPAHETVFDTLREAARLQLRSKVPLSGAKFRYGAVALSFISRLEVIEPRSGRIVCRFALHNIPRWCVSHAHRMLASALQWRHPDAVSETVVGSPVPVADARPFSHTSRARALRCADVYGFGVTPTGRARRAAVHAGMPVAPETAVWSPVPMAAARPFTRVSRARALRCTDVYGFGVTSTGRARRAAVHAGMPVAPETAVWSPVPMTASRPFTRISRARALRCTDVYGFVRFWNGSRRVSHQDSVDAPRRRRPVIWESSRGNPRQRREAGHPEVVPGQSSGG